MHFSILLVFLLLRDCLLLQICTLEGAAGVQSTEEDRDVVELELWKMRKVAMAVEAAEAAAMVPLY